MRRFAATMRALHSARLREPRRDQGVQREFLARARRAGAGPGEDWLPAQFQTVPPRSWKVAVSRRRLNPLNVDCCVYTLAPPEAEIDPESPSMMLFLMCTLAARAEMPVPCAMI